MKSGDTIRLRVTPFYGWGWYDAGGERIEVPRPFECDATIVELGSPFRSAFGFVDETGHTLAGLWIVMSQRHVAPDGDFNVFAFSEKPVVPKTPEPFSVEPILSGFASAVQIPGEPE